jgi:hypothetical protein
MRIRTLSILTVACVAIVLTALPAMAGWYTSSDPSDSTGATLRVNDSAKVSRDGWSVRWRLQVTCPKGQRIYGRALLAERDPASIPQLAGEDQGITATKRLQGDTRQRCTGHRQTLDLTLKVADTVVFDSSTGTSRTFHEPIHRAPASRTSASVQLFSSEAAPGPGFFVQYCAAPNCASESGPRVALR